MFSSISYSNYSIIGRRFIYGMDGSMDFDPDPSTALHSRTLHISSTMNNMERTISKIIALHPRNSLELHRI